MPTGRVRTVLLSQTGDGTLGSAARKMLSALAGFHPTRLTWGQVATLAGIAPRGGYFNGGRKQLTEGGHVEDAGGVLIATERGLEAIGVERTAAPTTPGEVRALWIARLPKPANLMLAELCAAPHVGRTREELAAALEIKPNGGYWNGGLSTLRRNGLLIERNGRLYPATILVETPK